MHLNCSTYLHMSTTCSLSCPGTLPLFIPVWNQIDSNSLISDCFHAQIKCYCSDLSTSTLYPTPLHFWSDSLESSKLVSIFRSHFLSTSDSEGGQACVRMSEYMCMGKGEHGREEMGRIHGILSCWEFIRHTYSVNVFVETKESGRR